MTHVFDAEWRNGFLWAAFRVCLRRGEGWTVKPEAEQVDNKVFMFRQGWLIEEGDRRYPGETAWIAHDTRWPADAPTWIASGDLEPDYVDLDSL